MSANVQSIAVIAEFRAALCTFILEARQAIAAMEMESRRAVDFITHDQAQHWQSETRRGWEAVSENKQNVSNARTFKAMDGYTPSCDEEKKSLEKAQRRLQNAQVKTEAVKHWGRLSEQAFREFTTRLSQFVSMLDGDLPKAVSTLERMLVSLDKYLATAAPAVARFEAAETLGAAAAAQPADGANVDNVNDEVQSPSVGNAQCGVPAPDETPRRPNNSEAVAHSQIDANATSPTSYQSE